MSRVIEKKLDAYFDWMQHNKDQMIILLAVGLFLIALIPLMITYHHKKAQERLQFYTTIQGYYYQNDFISSIEYADRFLEKYKKKNSRTKLVWVLKANALYHTQKYKEAEAIYKELLKEYPKDYLKPSFIDSLAYCQEMQGNYHEAIESWSRIINQYSDHYLVPNAYKSKARCYELLREYERSKEIYQLMNTMFTNTQWADFSKQRLSYLTLHQKIQPSSQGNPINA